MITTLNTKADGTTLVRCPKCTMCGKRAELTLSTAGVHRYLGGMLVQLAFPELSSDDRELIVSGTHPECWDELMGEEPEE